MKRLVKPGMGFFSFETSWHTLQGYEVMNRIREGQVRGVGKAEISGQVTFIASLFGVSAQAEQERATFCHGVPPRVFATQPE
jgi:IS6 family transposase